MTVEKPNCFVIMPITTPDRFLELYNGDRDHFGNVLDRLFVPAIEAAGMVPIRPVAQGDDVIQGRIIEKLERAELVLCDISILNPNVFFELGVRTAVNKTVALVRDDRTTVIPFDTAGINHHSYKAVPTWHLEAEIDNLVRHLKDCLESLDKGNSLWSHFAMSARAETVSSEDADTRQIEYLANQVAALRRDIHNQSRHVRQSVSVTGRSDADDLRTEIHDVLAGTDTPLIGISIVGIIVKVRTEGPISGERKSTISSICWKYGFHAVTWMGYDKPVTQSDVINPEDV